MSKLFSSVPFLFVMTSGVVVAAPICTPAAVSVVGGWGWENDESCVAVSVVDSRPNCQSAESDPDGDGFGWENGGTCVVVGGSTSSLGYSKPACLSQNSDPDGDGYGWENASSCVVTSVSTEVDVSNPAQGTAGDIINPECVLENSDPDGDGYGWENDTTCVTASVTELPELAPVSEMLPEPGNPEPEVIPETFPLLTLKNDFGSDQNVNAATDEIFAVLWDDTFDHLDDASLLLNYLSDVRTDSRGYGLLYPETYASGYYYNTYIHHGVDDSFPTTWGNSPLRDSDGLPYLVLWHSSSLLESNVYHEAFHIFQDNVSPAGFGKGPASDWFRETAALWYTSKKMPVGEQAFLYSQVVNQLPHLALWHSSTYSAATDPFSWRYQQHAHGISSLLYYMTSVENVDPMDFLSGYTQANGVTPQSYLMQQFGVDSMRDFFGKWAAENTAGLGFISASQRQASLDFIADRTDTVAEYPIAITVDEASYGEWLEPPTELAPRGWGYNVVKFQSPVISSYTVSVNGDELGSDGSSADFTVRAVVVDDDGTRIVRFDMQDDVTGTAEIEVTSSNSSVYLVVAATPLKLTGHQAYSYAIKVDKN